MNHIGLTKNGLLLLIYTQFIILLVVCMPICSTGIVKREIQSRNTTKLIWQPIKVANNTLDINVTTTASPQTSSSLTTTTTTTTTTAPNTSTTTEKLTSKETTEKNANIVSKQNITVTDTVIHSQSINDKNNLDDDAEVITLSDVDGTTTEEHHFDLSRYTSDYNGNDNEQNDYNETHQQLINDNESDADEHATYHVDYEHNLKEMVLTTPETSYFDEKHKEYDNDGMNFERYRDDNDRYNLTASINDSDADDRHYNSDLMLNDIHANSTEERKQSTYLNKAEVESTNYDTSAIEIKSIAIQNDTVGSEKKAKFLQEGSHVNLTIPNTAEVWALASMKNVEHTKNKQGQFFNVTTVQKEPDTLTNGTLVTKQLADWVEVMKNEDFTNNSFATANLANKTYRGSVKFAPKPLIISDQDSASQEHQIIAVQVTSLPPPIVLIRNYTRSTQSSAVVTEVVTDENADVETTTMPNELAPNVDNSQNELKTKFTKTKPSSAAKEFEPITEKDVDSTTERNFDHTTESNFGHTFERNSEHTTVFEEAISFDDPETENENEVLTMTQLIETTTPLVTNEQEYNNKHTTTEEEIVPTTNDVNLAVDSITEADENDDDHTMYVQSTRTSTKQSVTTYKDSLQPQSSTLQPQYVELEKTTEWKKPITEILRTTTDNFVQPTTEFITKMENKAITVEQIYDADVREELTTTVVNLNRDEYRYNAIKNQNPLEEFTTQSSHSPDAIPEIIDDFTQPSEQPTTDSSQIPDIGGYSLDEPDTNAIIAISVSVVGVVFLGIGLGVLYVMRKRQKQLSYGQRCRPVGLDAYSLDNVSVYNSVRRKGVLRTSKRSYGNAAFDDPGLKNNLLSVPSLAAFAQKRNEIYEEFRELPSVTARSEEVPVGCEDKNRYANIIPLPESRVFLKRIGDDERSEYINANYVKGPKDNSHYYIACQAPLESTVGDFWRMIWEQNSRVIIMATDLIENGIDQCAEYLPPSFVIDTHVSFGDFHITLKNREVKEKYAMSIIHLKNTSTNTWREITHFWYQWPDTGVPTEQTSLISLLLEARGFLRVSTVEQMDNNENSQSNNGNLKITNGSADKSKSLLRTQGPLTVHCSPGTGRTGTIIACDIALRALEQPTKSVDIPQIVYFVRRGRASAVRTREQYEFIYKVANVYAAKLTGPITEN